MRALTTLIALTCIVLFPGCNNVRQPTERDNSLSLERAFEQHAREVSVEGEGVVEKILADDRSGSPHQRFIVRLPSGETVLIEHNTELSRRIDDLKEGDRVSFAGEYVWNAQGGLVHWMHHDPAGRHAAGWIKHKGRTYQ